MADKVHFYSEIPFMEPGGRISVFKRGLLPVPLHFSESFLKLPFLSLWDKIGVGRALLWTGWAQTVAMIMYEVLAHSPGQLPVLYGTVATEAFAQGMADAAFLTYLSGLCSRAFTATRSATARRSSCRAATPWAFRSPPSTSVRWASRSIA